VNSPPEGSLESADRDHLRRMLLERSMRFGEFALSPGVTSNYYIDVRKTSLHPQGLQWISRLFWELLEPEGITAVGGLAVGADPLVAGLVLHSLQAGRPLDGFLVRRNSKDPGSLAQVEGNLAGHKRVAILDDLVTTGESALVAAEAAESYRAQVVKVVTVVDRNQGAAQVFQERGYPFTALFNVNDLLPAERG
jgi:orotate phosphoribosyltransferase